ncbi:N-acetylmuramic acid 6-phosphate etherase [Marinilactibacillus sp. Marseille-P9653]|uniref:N-acetylmuramic acid 6-phosphate etherase n=1 Tax=Marinilactibacillus sp. Marseille-P9653 TaxID=2866583 RepID=UPI001CE4A2AA|nr:N-acetylmuramic acid 6-phosphate etherase [Marinilactibacillus sp. Marseille-P9653]
MSTENRNQKSMELDRLSIKEMTQLMNEEDATVPTVIQENLDAINQLIEAVFERMEKGGRLFYIGAGTSGRLGILDAAECVPTFGISPEWVQGIIAGGEKAVVEAVEGAEDSSELAEEDLKRVRLSEKDVVIGIAASGRTPYVKGALRYAHSVGAQTGSISNNADAAISELANFPVEVATGPEVLTGSTRLKAGTAQKLVLNMISTVTMVKLGKAYENLMVDVQATNEKLVDRSKRIIMEATECSFEEAEKYYQESGSVKTAIVQILANTTVENANALLEKHNGRVRQSIQSTQ